MIVVISEMVVSNNFNLRCLMYTHKKNLAAYVGPCNVTIKGRVAEVCVTVMAFCGLC